jgi:hypothetical protein
MKTIILAFLVLSILASYATAQDTDTTDDPVENIDIPTMIVDDMVKKSEGYRDKKLMIVLDVTESMKPYYSQIIAWIRDSILSSLSSYNFSAGFVAFSDNSPRRKTLYNDYFAPVDMGVRGNIVEFIRRLPTLGELLVSGGDRPEDSITAMYNAIWYMRKVRDNDPEPVRFIILFTDNPYHTIEIPGDAKSVIICYEQLFDILLNGVEGYINGRTTLYAVTVDFEKLRNEYIRNVDMKKIADKSYKNLSEGTGGLWFELVSPE